MTIERINQELDKARESGPVRDIIIPPCPELLVRLQEATSVAEPDIGEIDRIAAADVAMAAALIRQANSPLYGLAHPVQTVGQALTVVGLNPAIRLLTGFLTRKAIRPTSALLAHFWESSTRRALACEHICSQLYSLDAGLAYSYGLFCHVGIAVMAQGVKGYASTMTEALARKDRMFIQTENVNHRTDHAVVGAIVARTWRLPAQVACAIRLHHDFDILQDQSTDGTIKSLIAVGLIAEHLVQRFEQLPALREWDKHGEACLAYLQVEAAEIELWEDQLYPQLSAVQLA